MSAELIDNRQDISSVLALEAQLEAMTDDKPLSFWRIATRRLRRDKLTLSAMIVLSLIAFIAIGADYISANILEVDPDKTDLLVTFEPPSSEHLLGTDALGRDQLSRLMFGGRISLAIGVLGALFTTLLGIGLGMSAAYFGKRVDDFVMWVINTLSAIPILFLLLIIGAFFELSAGWMIILFAMLGWPFITRLVRSTVFSLRERDYMIAARALGGSDFSILFRHVLPNVLPIVVIATMRTVGNLILFESALSFLGFGVQPPTSTWGTMLTKAQQFILIPSGRHLVAAPGIMITITVLCMFIIGDGLRDAMDPRLR
jgi:peptide/nickel transport system permease protein